MAEYFFKTIFILKLTLKVYLLLRYEPGKAKEESINDYFKSEILREVVFDGVLDKKDGFWKKLFSPTPDHPNKSISRLVYFCTVISSKTFKKSIKL